nr:uncharacterized protein LOC100974837 [Pan paniscus]
MLAPQVALVIFFCSSHCSLLAPPDSLFNYKYHLCLSLPRSTGEGSVTCSFLLLESLTLAVRAKLESIHSMEELGKKQRCICWIIVKASVSVTRGPRILELDLCLMDALRRPTNHQLLVLQLDPLYLGECTLFSNHFLPPVASHISCQFYSPASHPL